MGKIKKFNEFENKYQLIDIDDKLVLIYKTNKKEIHICEYDKKTDVNDYNNWNPCNISKRQGYAWIFNQMRPYRKYVKKGFLFTKQNNEFSVDFVSIEDNHFNDGYKDWEECDKCFGDGCDVCDFQGSVETNIKHTNYIDHIVIMKRSTYDKDEKLSEHTIININNKNIVVF